MRDTAAWRREITLSLEGIWQQEQPDMPIGRYCEVELGLHLLDCLDLTISAHALWALLAGQLLQVPEIQRWTPDQRQMLHNARHILAHYKYPYAWRQALERYRRVDARLRGYDVDAHLETHTLRAVSVCSDRFSHYHRALTHPLRLKKDTVHWAGAGTYSFLDQHWTSVSIPAELVFPPPSGHDLTGTSTRAPLEVAWEELLETARWMDTEGQARSLKPAHWEHRLARVRLELHSPGHGELARAERLTLNGLLHLIGMVSSGKSTLMDVLAVLVARRGLRVTLVVGDVIGALNRAQQFVQLGIKAAPVLGSSNRMRHTIRLHRVLEAEAPHSALLHDHAGFRWLSTACPLDGLRDTARPLAPGKQPCLGLVSGDTDTEDGQQPPNSRYACPLYGGCPTHQAQRDLVTARIWIATPASLVYTRVAPQLNPERPRFAELVYRCCDLVIIDEADQVQVQLDSIFSPAQTLVGSGADAWLDQLGQHVESQLRQQTRRQFVEERVRSWCQAHDVAQQATNRVYSMLLSEPTLREEIERDYFAPWLLLGRLREALTGQTDDGSAEPHALAATLDEFMDDPLGERGRNELASLAHEALLVTGEDEIRARLRTWLAGQASQELPPEVDPDVLAVQLEFALLVTVLSDRLDLLLNGWKQVEEALKLEGGSSLLFHNPPEDFLPVIPAAPMGNVLGFQYFHSPEGGTLRFLRCAGVGRWLLLHFHELFAGDGLAGPHVLLLSGTSWAGTSPAYHLQVPVHGILRAPDEEVAAVASSDFQFEHFSNEEGQPIRVSGLRGHEREAALMALLYQLARRSGLGGPSRLERERDLLSADRQRILLLVGSYVESRLAAEYLEQLRSDWRGQIRYLVADDDEFENHWQDTGSSLPRGLVHQFESTGAWLLVAPLLAVERGHNILNRRDEAAIGMACFLVRPHPRPDDIGFAIHSIDRWAVERLDAPPRTDSAIGFAEAGLAHRAEAFRRWRFLLKLPMRYTTMPKDEREALTWSQMVTLWQVIGRLVRGGSRARVLFCDAAFATRSAESSEDHDDASSSVLVGIRRVLRPYFDPRSATNPGERLLVDVLYGPFYQAINHMGGIADV